MTYESTCPRCGAMLTSGGCLSCGYPNGNLRDKIAADTALALKSSGDKPLGFVRYELLAEAWDSISKLGRELFDARTCIEELEAEIVNHESWLTTQQAATYAAEAERDEARRMLDELRDTMRRIENLEEKADAASWQQQAEINADLALRIAKERDEARRELAEKVSLEISAARRALDRKP